MKFEGIVHKFGDDINTDEIIPARYLNTTDPSELAAHCMEDADADFPKKVKKGDIIVAGKNFGCGSSREHAPVAIKGSGVSCVIATSFARIFYRNAFNIGLPIFELDQTDGINDGDELEVKVNEGTIIDKTSGKEYTTTPIPTFMQELISAGGLLEYVKQGRMK